MPGPHPQSALPITDALPAIRNAFKRNNSGSSTIVLNAPPGAGKTTVVPAELLPLCTGQILLIEPRRVAARNAAGALAERIGEPLGKTVGYAVRGDSKTSRSTRLKVVTPGVFLAMLQSDPELSGIDCVILDEFHERQRDIDLAAALTRDCQQGLREDLRLIIMSATLDKEELKRALPDAAFIESEGRQFEIDQRYSELTPLEAITELVAEETGDLLVFLPGRREIERLSTQLNAARLGIDVRALHGGLTLKEQRAVLAPGKQRRAILATNIAESSLTVPGVRIVVDAGLERRVEYDLARGVDELVTRPISRASATQRAGRAGRLEPGIALRLWRQAAHGARAAQTLPEIARSDLSRLLLQCAAWGAPPEDLPFVSLPPPGALARSRDALGPEGLGLLDEAGRPTELGSRCADLPLDPSQALLALFSQPELAVALAEEISDGRRPDLGPALKQMTGDQRKLVGRFRVKQPAATLDTTDALARAFPQWIAQRQNRTERERAVFGTVGGGQVLLEPGSDLDKFDYLAVGALIANERLPLPLISAALPLKLADLRRLFADRIERVERVSWSTRHEALEARMETRLGTLRLEHQNLPITKVASDVREAAVKGALSRLGGEQFLGEDAQRLLARLTIAQCEAGAPTLPDWDKLDWLDGFLDGVQRKADFKSVAWRTALGNRLDWGQKSWLDARFPEQMALPSGRTARIDYRTDPPRLSGKLQEFFGSAISPSVNDGKLPLALDLLSPRGHSLAITRDLPAFWAGAYKEVAKEGRAQFVKHPWPDDPATAQATALTNRKLKAG